MRTRAAWVAAVALALLTATGVGTQVPRLGSEPEKPPSVTDAREEGGRDWPMFRSDINHSAYTPEEVTPPLAVAWIYSTGGPIVSSPTVVNGRVYFGSRDSTLYVLNATTGKLIWKYKTRGWVDSSPTISDGLIYFASRDGSIYSLTTFSGRLTWRYYAGGTNCSSPALADGILYIGSGFPNRDILALTARSGQLIWSYQTDQPVYSSPAVKDRVVYIGSNDGRFYSLSLDEAATRNPIPASLKWSFQTQGGVYFSSPAISDSLSYSVSGNYDKHIYCLRLSDGSVRWSYEVENSKAPEGHTPFNNRYRGRIEGAPSVPKDADWTYPFVYVSSPALAHSMVYFVSGYPDQSLYALDALDGSLRWNQTIGRAANIGLSSCPAIADSVVYVCSGEGKIHSFDAVNGSPLWSYDTDTPIVSSPAVAAGRLWVGTLAGDLYCLQPLSKPLASVGEELSQTTPVLPKTQTLLPPTPNPFTSATTILYAIPSAVGRPRTAVTLSVYDLGGSLVKNVLDEAKEPGYHTVTWDATDSHGKKVPAGVYFLRMSGLGFDRTRKVTLLR